MTISKKQLAEARRDGYNEGLYQGRKEAETAATAKNRTAKEAALVELAKQTAWGMKAQASAMFSLSQVIKEFKK